MRRGWRLIWKGKLITGPKKKKSKFRRSWRFALKLPIYGRKTTTVLKAKSPSGKVYEETVIVIYPGWQTLLYEARFLNSRREFLFASLGFTALSYTEENVPDIFMTGLTVKVSYLYRIIPPDWDIGLGAYFTALPTSTSHPDAAARFLGINFRFGYVVPGIRRPWRLSVLAGWYYTTMFVKGGAYGFNNMSGPQLFPVLKKTLNKKDSIVAYLKFSPILDQFGFLSIGSSRELAIGASWNHMLPNGHPISYSLNIANLKLLVKNEIPISSTSISLGIGYGL